MQSTKRKASSELASPQQKRLRLGDYKDDERALPTGSTQGLTATSSFSTASQSPAGPQSPPGSPLRRQSPQPNHPSTSSAVEVEEEEEADDELLCRIQSGIEYVHEQQSKGEAIMQTTRFELTTKSPSPALDLLRRHATLVHTSTTHEVYELGVPRPDWVTAGILTGLHDPQWWLNKTVAEVKAGPHAEENDVKRAQGHLKGLQTRKNKKKVLTAREKEIEWKLREGARRQEMSLRMCDSDPEETDDESEIEEVWVGGGYESEESEEEEEMPVKRRQRTMAAKAPRSRLRLSVIQEVEDEN
ncbi:uncharacterized protein K460DRAFT_279972 [Cucurbitaria berberidis CBS 394.84]|uniref:Uncharacterized protein n=1 Tax=Cucurbitaria berberidis CBS 394.84 TaxID=1168544 RepID=A0A9P4GJ09_9PLEO|nr:uncharacterized protein K460DRAFT_279972 [Cucurbitaria berberidis CBS 394.84]KAF1847093.1 hypothetical protein K460DRAFT_279972 [Cucurbitaria berberidis CBS 394.84]